MVVGFVLISAAPGAERDVHLALQAVPEITELHPLLGEDDFIAKIEAVDFDTLGSIIIGRIRSIAGVTDSRTLTATKL